jgi:hypothetical protein
MVTTNDQERGARRRRWTISECRTDDGSSPGPITEPPTAGRWAHEQSRRVEEGRLPLWPSHLARVE